MYARVISDTCYRLLVPEKKVKVIIGPGGKHIKETKQKCSRGCKITVFTVFPDGSPFHPEAADRVCQVDVTTLDDLDIVLFELVPHVQGAPEENKLKYLKLLVPDYVCSLIIGYKGQNVQHIQEKFSSRVVVHTDPLPYSSEHVVTVSNLDIQRLNATVIMIYESILAEKTISRVNLFNPSFWRPGEFGNTGSYNELQRPFGNDESNESHSVGHYRENTARGNVGYADGLSSSDEKRSFGGRRNPEGYVGANNGRSFERAGPSRQERSRGRGPYRGGCDRGGSRGFNHEGQRGKSFHKQVREESHHGYNRGQGHRGYSRGHSHSNYSRGGSHHAYNRGRHDHGQHVERLDQGGSWERSDRGVHSRGRSNRWLPRNQTYVKERHGQRAESKDSVAKDEAPSVKSEEFILASKSPSDGEDEEDRRDSSSEKEKEEEEENQVPEPSNQSPLPKFKETVCTNHRERTRTDSGRRRDSIELEISGLEISSPELPRRPFPSSSSRL